MPSLREIAERADRARADRARADRARADIYIVTPYTPTIHEIRAALRAAREISDAPAIAFYEQLLRQAVQAVRP